MQGTRRGYADLAGGSKAHGEEMQMEQSEARHTERKGRFRRRKQGTRRGHADLAVGSKAHGEEMQI